MKPVSAEELADKLDRLLAVLEEPAYKLDYPLQPLQQYVVSLQGVNAVLPISVHLDTFDNGTGLQVTIKDAYGAVIWRRMVVLCAQSWSDHFRSS